MRHVFDGIEVRMNKNKKVKIKALKIIKYFVSQAFLYMSLYVFALFYYNYQYWGDRILYAVMLLILPPIVVFFAAYVITNENGDLR